jgi:hypothetical protein
MSSWAVSIGVESEAFADGLRLYCSDSRLQETERSCSPFLLSVAQRWDVSGICACTYLDIVANKETPYINSLASHFFFLGANSGRPRSGTGKGC